MHWEIAIALVFLFLSEKVNSRPFDVEDTKDSFYWRRNNEEKCEPFETFMIDCNRCICSADGEPYCTKVACIDMKLVKSMRKKSRTTSIRTMSYDDYNNINQLQHY